MKNLNVDAENQTNIVFKNQSQNFIKTNIDVMPSQLQEEFIMKMSKEESIMQLPVIKSISCTGTAQTNTRLCGLIEASDLADEFRFNCFYCCDVYPLEKWKNFVNHLKNKHFKTEAAFKVSEYVTEDHDYTPKGLSPCNYAEADLETSSIKVESLLPSLEDPLGTEHNPFETVIFKPTYYYRPDENETFAANENNFNEMKSNSEQTVSNSSLKETNVKEDQEKYKSDGIELAQQTPTEISFEFSPREIVDLLLDSMKNYPVLWQFDEEPFNEDFYEAVEEMCKKINDKWSMNIDNLKMRRSINRILRFYCYFFTNEIGENNDQFTCYYDKCCNFLPASASEVAYARCSHCYICFRNDFDLKLHLFEEQKYLKWPLKCVQCKECFIQNDEFEFHKRLPHYDEIFRCVPCNKTFFHRKMYNKHILEYHPKVCNDPGNYTCSICGKTFHSSSNLRGHIAIHGERKYNCHLCPKTFLANSKLMIHLKSHRKEYDFMCEICGKGFLCQSNLTTHMNKHTGEKVTCNICNLKLRKSSLGRHLRTAHVPLEGIVETMSRKHLYYRRLIRPRQLLSIRRKRGERRTYKCKICKINFEKYKSIVEHNKELHFDIPKWPCKMCSTEFSQKLNLKCHYRKKHNLDVIQVYKLVDENEDLDLVLALNKEHLDKLADATIVSKNKQDNAEKSKIKSPTKKSHLLPDDFFFEEEKFHSSTIQDEIMKVDDKIRSQEPKIDNINDFFTDLLKEYQKNI